MIVAAKVMHHIDIFIKAGDSLVDNKIFMFSNGASTRVNGYLELEYVVLLMPEQLLPLTSLPRPGL